GRPCRARVLRSCRFLVRDVSWMLLHVFFDSSYLRQAKHHLATWRSVQLYPAVWQAAVRPFVSSVSSAMTKSQCFNVNIRWLSVQNFIKERNVIPNVALDHLFFLIGNPSPKTMSA